MEEHWLAIWGFFLHARRAGGRTIGCQVHFYGTKLCMPSCTSVTGNNKSASSRESAVQCTPNRSPLKFRVFPFAWETFYIHTSLLLNMEASINRELHVYLTILLAQYLLLEVGILL